MKTSKPLRLALRLVTLCAVAMASSGFAPPTLSHDVRHSLAKAGTNKDNLVQAYQLLPPSQHKAVDFLLANMPDRDLAALDAAFLAEHVRYSYKAVAEKPWARDLPREIFFNYVLPYSNLDERRDSWRKTFYEEFAPFMKDCKTAGDVAVRLNTTIFDAVNVHYSKQRPKANQSPFESTEATKASCTGLSILLVDACRAMGVPARVVGTPLWTDRSGNHTWAEIWDNGWHALGASESRSLDKAWFIGKAASAIKGDPDHAIYAASFEKTGQHFPLVWNRNARYVPAHDVTARYTRPSSKAISLSQIKKILDSGPLTTVAASLNEQDTRFDARFLHEVKELAWAKYCKEISQDVQRRKEHEAKAVTFAKKTMRYAYKRVGKKPTAGYPLYIALHGGGGAPAAVNDSQWAHMQRYYLGGVNTGIYLAPRGVCDAWNLHWVRESLVCYDRIIENMIVFENVDPNRVYLMGFSAGGDAAYQVPARMPDRWAGAAMSAGHPNGVSPVNYASLAFLVQVGELDKAYNRNKVAAQYGVKLAALRKAHPEHYRHAIRIHKGRGHGFMDRAPDGSPQSVYVDPGAWLDNASKAVVTTVDCNSVHWLDQFARNPLPARVLWDCATTSDRSGNEMPGFWPTSEKGKLHYWLGIDRYTEEVPLVATRIVAQYDKASNTVTVSEAGNFVRIYVAPEMLDLSRDVAITIAGKTKRVRVTPNLRTLLVTLLDRGDKSYIFAASIALRKNPEGDWLVEPSGN